MGSGHALRVAVAGLGFGGAVHVPTFLRMPDVSVVAIMGRRPDRARAAAEQIGAVPCVTVEELFDRSLDAVSIALPPAETAVLTAEALRRGIAVLAEKPLAPTATMAFALADAAQNGRLANTVDFEFAELGCFRSMAAALTQQQIGRLMHVAIEWRGLSYAQERQIWSWKSDAAQHGGVLTLLGTHLLHMANQLFGPMRVQDAHLTSHATARFAPLGEVPAEDTVRLQLTGVDALPVSVLLSNADSRSPLHRWIVRGIDGEMIMENDGRDPVRGFTLKVRRRGADEVVVHESADGAGGDSRLVPFGRLAHRFVEAVRTGSNVEPDFLAAARTQQLIDDIRSFKAGNAP